jgi:excisionase family DNA binding protein
MRELTTKEVAERLNISMRQVQTLIQQNRLPAEKKGRDWFVKESDLALVSERPKTGRPPKNKSSKQESNKKDAKK